MDDLNIIKIKICGLFDNKYFGKKINSDEEGIELSDKFEKEVIKFFNKNEYSMIKLALKCNPYANKITNWHCVLYKNIKNILIKSYDDYRKNCKLGYAMFKKDGRRFMIKDWNQEPTEAVLTEVIILNN